MAYVYVEVSSDMAGLCSAAGKHLMVPIGIHLHCGAVLWAIMHTVLRLSVWLACLPFVNVKITGFLETFWSSLNSIL